MRARGRIGATVALGALVALVALAGACTSGGERQRATRGPTYHPTGRLVALVGRFGGHIVLQDVATGNTIDMTLPAVFGSWGAAWRGPRGRLYAMPLVFDATARSQLYLVGGKQAPRRVGPSLAGVIGFQVTAGYAVAWACPGVFLMDLSDPSGWKRVSPGCGAAMSPDGRRLAFATESALWVMDVPDGTPREVLRFADLDELGRAHIQHRSLEQVSWGRAGWRWPSATPRGAPWPSGTTTGRRWSTSSARFVSARCGGSPGGTCWRSSTTRLAASCSRSIPGRGRSGCWRRSGPPRATLGRQTAVPWV